MATYEETFNLWQTPKLKKQIAIAVLNSAATVISEPVGTANHALRLTWAKSVIIDPGLQSLRISAGVVLNATVQSGTATDAQIQAIVDSLVNVFAGI